MRIILFDPDCKEAHEDSTFVQSSAMPNEPSKKHWNVDGRWLVFDDLVELFETSSINEVMPLIDSLESKVLREGGFAAGWISYEAAPAFDQSLHTKPLKNFPLIKFGHFKRCRKMTAEALFAESWMDDDGHAENYQNFPVDWQLNCNEDDYAKAINDIKWQIEQGNTYQVNFTLRQYCDYVGSPWALFEKMSSQARYGAFIDDDEYVICSASPELFFKKKDSLIYSKPMKGTSKRGMTLATDSQLSDELQSSSKNRAENLMIVDMIRNDLSKIADKGSVKVPKLFDVEKYPTVWQMTSTVEAKTKASIGDILKALFPCASITGAPKVNTMKIIGALENTPRKIYCGAIGYFSRNNQGSCDAQFSVPIRTLLLDKRYAQAEYGVGSGIVWDSQAKEEFQECLIKSRVLKDDLNRQSFYLFETIRWQSEVDNSKTHGFYLLDKHLRRMSQSAEYFDFPFSGEAITLKLMALEAHWKSLKEDKFSARRVRAMLDYQGNVTIESVELDVKKIDRDSQDKTTKKRVKLIEQPVNSSNRWLYHKSSNRAVYEQFQQQYKNYDDVLLVNEYAHITESCIANFFYTLKDDEPDASIDIQSNGLNVINTHCKPLYTPPVSDGLLNGTYRQQLLENNQVIERSLSTDELAKIECAYLANSVRKIYSINIVI